MKILFYLLLFCPAYLFAQEKNKVYYKAEQIKSFAIADYGKSTSSVLSEKVFGIDVEIVVDTIFKKYDIFFNDEDGKRTYLSYRFVRDYDNSAKVGKPRNQIRHYQMNIDEDYFTLDDYLDSFAKVLHIAFEKQLADGCVMVFSVVDAIKK